MSENNDTARTIASAPASGVAPGAGEEVPDWLASERAAAEEAGEPVETPSVSVAASPDVEAASEPAPVSAPGSVTAPGSATVLERPAVTKASIADIEEAMKDVVDPELGINVVDLGLVYGTHVDDENVVTIDMTLTSAACPLTDVIEDQTRQALTTGPGGGLVNDFRINWVWLPPWGPDKITDDGRDQLRTLGFNV
jgi:metal-sulfur cluster biosynthetic enzyme